MRTPIVAALGLGLGACEKPDRQQLSLMNLRLPGNASLDALEFTPEDDVAPEVGGLIELDGGLETPDAG